MKLVKLSLVAALAAGSFSALSAKPLEEAIKNVEVSGALRYRYDTVTWQGHARKHGNFGAYGIGNNAQPHHFRAFTGIKLDAGDNFKIFGQIMYNNDANGGWGSGTATSTNTHAQNVKNYGLTNTKQELVLKQAYLQYDAADAGLSLILGKQELGTIWTADFVGTAAKVLFTPAEGLTVAGFVVDSFEGSNGDGDALALDKTGIYGNNMYGAAVLANVAGLNAQVWGAHWDRLATLYAVNLKYTLGFGGNDNAGVKLTYLGNNPTKHLKNMLYKDGVGAGNLVDGRLFVNVAGLDARVGGIFYGKKDRTTINTLEDTTGPDLYIGREIFYTSGSALVQSFGQNVFGYVGVGYTLPANFRVGVQGVFGQNTSNDKNHPDKVGTDVKDVKDTRWEGVVELSYKASKNLSFETWYSYISSNRDDKSIPKGNGEFEDYEGSKQTVRFQALYKF